MAKVRALLGRHLHTAPLLDGEVIVDGAELEVTQLASNSAAWGGWPRNPDGGFPYDVSEMSLGVGLGCKDYGLPFTPIPVFLTRRLDLHRILYNADSGINAPRDLEGRRVAAGGYFTDVDIYQAAALQEMGGVDLRAVRWVAVREQHIAAVKIPSEVAALPGADVNMLIESGQVAAVTNGYSGSSPRVRQLLHPERDTEKWLAKYGHFPILHTVVVSNALLAENPGFAQRLYEAFVRAKQPFLRRLANEEDVWSEMDPEVAEHTFGVMSASRLRRPDPVPYGIGQNRALLELAVHHLRERGYLSRAWQLEELFAVTGGASD